MFSVNVDQSEFEKKLETSLLPDPGLFRSEHKITLPLGKSQEYVLRSWLPMFKDHCIFIYFALIPCGELCGGLKPDFWKEGKQSLLKVGNNDFDMKTQTIEKLYTVSGKLEKIKRLGAELAKEWKQFETRVESIKEGGMDLLHLSHYISLWNETYRLKKSVLCLLTQKIWIGNMDTSFVRGMLFELYYVRARLENSISPKEEMALIMDDIGLHLSLTAQSLESSAFNARERKSIRELLAYAELRFEFRDRVTTSIKLDKETLEKGIFFIEENKRFFVNQHRSNRLSKAHEIMALHSIRETIFEIERLHELLQTMNT